MNLSSFFGAVVIAVVLFFGVFHSAKNPFIFLNGHAVILVLGGTLGVTLLAYPLKKIKELTDFLVYGLFLKSKAEDLYIVGDLIRVSEEYRKDPQNFLNSYSISNQFLKEGAALLAKTALTHDDLVMIIKNRRDSFKRRYQDDYKMLLAMAKFPPGLGLLGASSGMIEMMTGLSSGGMNGIGEAMAVALVATFWGIAIANFVLLPLADYAHRMAQEDYFTRNLVLTGISLIKQEVSTKIIAESLISQLPIKDQVGLRQIFFRNNVDTKKYPGAAFVHGSGGPLTEEVAGHQAPPTEVPDLETMDQSEDLSHGEHEPTVRLDVELHENLDSSEAERQSALPVEAAVPEDFEANLEEPFNEKTEAIIVEVAAEPKTTAEPEGVVLVMPDVAQLEEPETPERDDDASRKTGT